MGKHTRIAVVIRVFAVVGVTAITILLSRYGAMILRAETLYTSSRTPFTVVRKYTFPSGRGGYSELTAYRADGSYVGWVLIPGDPTPQARGYVNVSKKEHGDIDTVTKTYMLLPLLDSTIARLRLNKFPTTCEAAYGGRGHTAICEDTDEWRFGRDLKRVKLTGTMNYGAFQSYDEYLIDRPSASSQLRKGR
jgi:hypothetical protein